MGQREDGFGISVPGTIKASVVLATTRLLRLRSGGGDDFLGNKSPGPLPGALGSCRIHEVFIATASACPLACNPIQVLGSPTHLRAER